MFLRISLLLVSLFCLCADVHAQGRSTFGFNFGYEFGVPLDISRDSGQANPLGSAIAGTSQNHTGWLGARYNIPHVVDDIHLRLGLDYGLSIGQFVSDSYFDDVDVLFGGIGVPENEKIAEKTFTVQSTNHLFSPSINFDWQPGTSWRLGVGVWSTVRIGGSATREEEIIDPIETKRFESTDTRTRDLFPAAPVSFTYFRFGPSISSSWKMSAGRNLEFRPEIFGKLDITQADDLGLRAFSAGVRFNFIFDAEERRDQNVVSGNDDIQVAPFTADVRITSNGVSLNNSVTAQPRTILYRRFETVLPFIEIPTVTDRERVIRLIDILGKRIAETPATLTLAPTNSDAILEFAGKELGDSISSAAIRQVRQAGSQHAAPLTVGLQSPVRLRGVTTSGLIVNSDQPALLRPLADQWIDSRYQLPPITIERYTDTRAGLRSWNVNVRQGRRMLAKYSNLEGSTAELESGLFLTSDQSSNIEPVTAEMTATDLDGQVTTVYDTLQIRKGVADPARADSTVYEFLFYSAPSGNGLIDLLSVQNKVIMKTMKDQLGSAKNIEIHYSSRSQKFAAEIFTEISGLVSDSDKSPEIKLRSSRDVAAPTGVMAVKVLVSN